MSEVTYTKCDGCGNVTPDEPRDIPLYAVEWSRLVTNGETYEPVPGVHEEGAGGGGAGMTGIERLRKLANELDLEEMTYDCLELRKIADQIEHEMLPRTRFEDGKIARIGEVARYLGKNRTIANICVTTSGYHRVLFNDNVDLTLRPSEMLLRPVTKVLDADGVEIKVGDEVWGIGREQHAYKVLEPASDDEYAHGRFTVKCVDLTDGELDVYADPSSLTHKRPESPDTWERIEDDILNKVSPCEYFGWSGKSCCDDGECPVFGNKISCTESRASDLVRRCKALAGVE